MEKINCYIIGAGTMAGKFARTLEKDPEAVLSGMVIRDPEKTEYYRELYPQIKTFPDVDTLLDQDLPANSLVIIATPPFTHYEIARKVIAHRCHILCEKPLATSYHDAQILAEEAEKAGILHACCESRFSRFHPVLLAKKHIEQGKLGEIYFIEQKGLTRLFRPGIEYQPESQWYYNRAKAGGGPFLDWGVYDLAVLRKICGDFSSITVKHSLFRNNLLEDSYAQNQEYDVEEHGLAVSEIMCKEGRSFTYSHERSMVVHGDSSLKLRICGTKGGIEMNWIPEDTFFNFYFYSKEFGECKINHTIHSDFNFDTYPLENMLLAIKNKDKIDISFKDAAEHIGYFEKINPC